MKLRNRGWILLCGLLLLAGCHVDLEHDLSEEDANQIYVALNENGISCEKLRVDTGQEPSYTIQVPQADAAQAAKLLHEYSLPRPHADGLSIFKKSKGMIPTETEQRAMMLEALGGEVSNALDKVDGVLEAKAIVMIPKQNELVREEDQPKPSASVFVKYRPDLEGNSPLSEKEIRQFVANAVPNLDPAQVTVLLTEAEKPTAAVTDQTRMKTVLGLQMTAASAEHFKWLFGGALLLVVLLIFLVCWMFLRGDSTVPQPRPVRARPRPPEA